MPRSFLQPGRRLKLHPDHYYALGMHRGGVMNAGSARPKRPTTIATGMKVSPTSSQEEKFLLRMRSLS
ncbi:MAG: hypothetical protein R3B91_21910 [Planctomycetaceae bacterium]